MALALALVLRLPPKYFDEFSPDQLIFRLKPDTDKLLALEAKIVLK